MYVIFSIFYPMGYVHMLYSVFEHILPHGTQNSLKITFIKDLLKLKITT